MGKGRYQMERTLQNGLRINVHVTQKKMYMLHKHIHTVCVCEVQALLTAFPFCLCNPHRKATSQKSNCLCSALSPHFPCLP